MHKSTTCFQNSHKFWNLAVRFQKHGSLHAESMKGSDIWWDGSHYISQGFWAVPIYTAKSVLARGKRGAGGPWHGLLRLTTAPGTRRKSEVCCGTSPQPRSAQAGWIPACCCGHPWSYTKPSLAQSLCSRAGATMPLQYLSWCLQSSGQRRALNKHDSHSLVGTLNAVSSLSPLLGLPAE